MGNHESWIVPCNPKYYKVREAFAENTKLNWKQSSPKMEVEYCN